MKFLGIRNGHDCNITYTDGERVRYIKFERNFQKKHYNWGHDNGDDVPRLLQATQKILNISLNDLDAICLANAIPEHVLNQSPQLNQLWCAVDTQKAPFWSQFNCPIFMIDHHYSHALSCWPLTDVTKIRTHFVFDGLGDYERVSGIFQNNKLVDFIDRTENYGLSVTLEQIGQEYGIKGMVLDISGKLMALKSYHNVPEPFTQQLMSLAEPFRYRHLNQFINLVNQAQSYLQPVPDKQQSLINLAYFLHVFGEEKLPEYFLTYAPDVNETITYSGGTAQNTVVNSRIKAVYKNLHIPPHCPDDGISLGCVEFLRQMYNQPLFDNSNFPYWQSDQAPTSSPTASTIEKTAELLAQGKIVGWYQGQGELGPRALGNRSILMDPSIKGGKDLINAKVKHREPYRPFGASILHEYTNEIFDCDYESPYMLYVIGCRKQEEFASIVHVDKTCRIQTVNHDPQYALYRDLIEQFRRKTGIPMVLNTSLNVDGKPIAGHPDDALTLLKNSEMDAVVIGNDFYIK